jgi:hypothetical protein
MFRSTTPLGWMRGFRHWQPQPKERDPGEHDGQATLPRADATDAGQQRGHEPSAGLWREQCYKGSGRLTDKKTIITGADSGIGRAVALAFAREGADVLISYLNEHEDARETQRLVEEAGRKAVLVPGDLQDPAHCRAIVARAVEAFGRVDILVNNAELSVN